MRQILTFSTIIFFFACGQPSDQTTATQDNISPSVDNISTVDSSMRSETSQTSVNNKMELTGLEWKKHEDSLRNEILKKKENKVLKESFLQEMYIRNAVIVSKNSLFVTIPFNVHGADCGAPDCYSTDISFNFTFGDTLIFPDKLQFQEYEHGCIEKEIKFSDNFVLVEQTDKHVIYYSTKYKRTLVLFNSNIESGTSAYYFTGLGQNRINGKNVYKIMKDFDEEDKNAIYPFTSWILTTNEYENFTH